MDLDGSDEKLNQGGPHQSGLQAQRSAALHQAHMRRTR
jgi:hypothetical protein